MNHYPLFAHLHNRPVLLVGAGQVAERKAESLMQAGALVRVVAPALSSVFQEWVQQHRLSWLADAFAPAQLDEVFLVVCATDDTPLNQHIFQAAERAGKFCNVVDDAERCSFIVPAIVDRSPVQVAISSAGHAPVLARHWKQKIEALLPHHTGKLAEVAGTWRPQVKAQFGSMAQRRLFWENLFASRFDTLIAQGRLADAEQELVKQLNAQAPLQGEVVLVGAGPGDAGLLTLKALQAMQAADVVLYDALVSDEIRALIRKDAEQICVGKRAGAHQVQQQHTNALLVELAQQGKRVVRLKGGDPFVFGRGGEEVQVLVEAGIPFRVVPGITAALGATAYAGIPLTHRNLAQTALFITGHCRADGDALDWASLARSRQTLAVYMGTIKAADITAELIRHGRAANTPVAVISNGTRDNQSVQTGTLQQLPTLAECAPQPALIIIGEVAALHHQLAWFQHTRPSAAA